MSFLIGLTGSIGMGKSTTAQLFADAGCAVWDADAAVHRLYAQGGAAVAALQARFPQAIRDGAVDRSKLKAIIGQTPEALREIERIVHPLVAADRADFIAQAKADVIILDIPLLFETGADQNVDATVTVYVSPEEQRRRVLARGSMSEAQFEQILAKQLPSDTKCAQSDFTIETVSIEDARAQVHAILDEIKGQLADA